MNERQLNVILKAIDTNLILLMYYVMVETVLCLFDWMF